MGNLIREFNWSSTSLGPIDSWMPVLRSTLSMMLASKFPMVIFWGKDLTTFYNDSFRPSLGNDGKHPSSLGQPAEISWSESWPVIGSMIHNIMAGGDSIWFEDQQLPVYRDGKMDSAYWTYSFSALRNDEEEIAGLLVTCTETTKAVEEYQKIAQIKKQQELALDAAELGTWDLNPATGKFISNNRLKEWFGLAPEAEIELPFAINVIDKKDRDRVIAAINYAMKFESRGSYDEEYVIINPTNNNRRVVHAKGKTTFNEAGEAVRLNGTLRDITKERMAEQAIRESEAKFRMLVNEAPFATALYTGMDIIVDLANEPMLAFWGKSKSVIGKKLIEAVPELDGQPFIALLEKVMETRVAYSAKEQGAELIVNGRLQRFYFNFTYKPLFDVDGKVNGILHMAVDVTDQVNARQKIEEVQSKLQNAIEIAQLATWEIDIKTGKISYSQRLQQWLGVAEGHMVPEGSPRVSPTDRQRIQAALTRATAAGTDGVFDEVYSIVNESLGQQRTIHAVGRVLSDANGEPATLVGTAQDITIEREAHLALENAVQLRTVELAAAIETLKNTNEKLEEVNNKLVHSNEELSQYAHAASHDLQEPLRKIALFSSRLDSYPHFPVDLKETVLKIRNSTERMSLLIRGLLEFSQLLDSDKLIGPVNLQEVVEDIIKDFELTIQEKKAQILLGQLPIVEGVSLQLNQLFYNLIGNSLKFSKPGAGPVIEIYAATASEDMLRNHLDKFDADQTYYLISVKDNGIGFDQQYVQQIFEVFKRLHNRTEFAGSGIGLSLCRRIAENHQGKIFANATAGIGAAFQIILPARQIRMNAD